MTSDREDVRRNVELEAVAPPQSDLTHEHDLIAELREAFAITDQRLVAHGYANQLLDQPARSRPLM